MTVLQAGDVFGLLVVSQLEYGSTSWSRLKVLRELSGRAQAVDVSPYVNNLQHWRQLLTNHLYTGPAIAAINRLILELAVQMNPDVLWVDKGLHVTPDTLREVRKLGCDLLIHFSPDNQMVRANQSRYYLRSIPEYDIHVTTKTHNIHWLRLVGARRVEVVRKGFDPELHRPVRLNAEDESKYGCDIGFVGHWEPSREEVLLWLSELGYRVKVWGGNWRHCARREHPLFANAEHLVGDEYAKAICGAKINLCLLSQWFADRTTCRSIEIPACGGFMLAERNVEHLALFREGVEAEFYDDRREMLSKIDECLRDESRRQAIAAAGRVRCLVEYSNQTWLQNFFHECLSISH
jgi:spore maturation protein CgeB